MSTPTPPILLFGYASSPFTNKVRLSLLLKRLPYTFIPVPSMLPRPLLLSAFSLPYRKIPLLAIGRDVYADTSLIIEALESRFPSSSLSSGEDSASAGGYGTLYPRDALNRRNRSLMRGFASYWIDRPFFRITTGLIPARVWRSRFGRDRAGLIGHVLDPAKLEAKIPRNLAALDLQLGFFEEWLAESGSEGQGGGGWLFATPTPSLADITLYYQLDWGREIASGRGIGQLTAGEAPDTDDVGMGEVFNADRYPRLWDWWSRLRSYFDSLPPVETRLEKDDDEGINDAIESLKIHPKLGARCMLPTPAETLETLHEQIGLIPGTRVSVAPDDTGRDDPTVGTLVGLTTEEVVIEELERVDGREPSVDIAVHFPRLGFVVKPLGRGGEGARSCE